MKYIKLFFSYRARQIEKHGFEKNAFKVFSSKNSMFLSTWKKIHDFQNFSNSGLKFYMRISECICIRIMMKKKTHLQEKLPLIHVVVSNDSQKSNWWLKLKSIKFLIRTILLISCNKGAIKSTACNKKLDKSLCIFGLWKDNIQTV